MRVLVVCHYAAPEIGAPQARWSEMARAWVTSGHDVELLTGMPNHPTGVVHEGYRRRLRIHEEIDGVSVRRCWLYATANEGIVKKTLGHLSFMVTGMLLWWRALAKPDVVVVSSPTFFSILTAWVLAKRWRVPLVVEVRDLWPGIFVDLGVLKQKQLIWLLERLELAAYRAAATVVVVTEGFKEDLVRRGVPAGKVAVITNGVDLERFAPGPANPGVRRRLGAIDDDTLVVYIGAHGISHGLGAVLDAARRFEPGVRLALVGEGADKAALVARAEAEGLKNVTFVDGVPRDDVADILRSADVLLVPLRAIPLFETFIPSKMFEFLAVEGCVVGSVSGEAASILKAAGATVVAPEDADALAAAINELAVDRGRRDDHGRAGRAYVEQHYDRRVLAERYLSELADSLAVAAA